MDNLNLPDKFREIEEWLCECEAMTKAEYHDKTNSAITISKAREIFTALSDARDKIAVQKGIIEINRKYFVESTRKITRLTKELDTLKERINELEQRAE